MGKSQTYSRSHRRRAKAMLKNWKAGAHHKLQSGRTGSLHYKKRKRANIGTDISDGVACVIEQYGPVLRRLGTIKEEMYSSVQEAFEANRR